MSRKLEVPVGKVFGYWEVLAEGKGQTWLCLCLCGSKKEVNKQHLRKGATKSCGCRPRVGPTKHGMSEVSGLEGKVYRAWKNIKQRTLNRKNDHYQVYGGRGILLDNDYVNDFAAFLAEVGLPPSLGHSIDRKNNDLGYVKGNMRWATSKEQSLNTSRSRKLSLNGEVKTLQEWADFLGISRSVIRARIDKLGWTVEKALSTSVRPMNFIA
jgi:hypothetical protein